MTVSQRFGRILDAGAVERAALETLRTWTPTYLAEVARQVGRDSRSLPTPRAWVTSADLDRLVEEQTPAVYLLSSGLADEPTKDGKGAITARWTLGVAAIVSAGKREDADALSKLYTATLRGILIQRPSLGGFAIGTDWLDEEYGEVPSKQRRSHAAGRAIFRITVEEAAHARRGPTIVEEPPPNPHEPPPNDPRVTAVIADFDPQEIV